MGGPPGATAHSRAAPASLRPMGAACVGRGRVRAAHSAGARLLPTSRAPGAGVSAASQPTGRKMGAAAARRCVEWLLGLYFVSHIPVTLFIDLQVVLPPELYPQEFSNLLRWYSKEFKDPLMQDPPVWFRSFVFCELVFQLPFFPIAAYAFFKGSCRWIRTPAIIYAVHTITTLIPILYTFLLEDFSKDAAFKGQRPKNFRERLTLIGVYAPYLIIPLILLLFMLRNPYYKYEEKRKRK